MSSLVQMYSRKIGELEKRIAQLENINRELSGSLEWHVEVSERYEKALETIMKDSELVNGIHNKVSYSYPGKIAKKALEG